jgi:hypothetical protein
MVIAGDIGSLTDQYHQQLPWQSCKAKEIYQTTYITSNYHGNPVKLKKSIRLPISPAIAMQSCTSLALQHCHGNCW